ACERTGHAMWVPFGEYFVADRPRGAQPRGTVMDYLVAQGRQAGRPEGYGVHHVGQVNPSENRNIQGPRRHLANMVRTAAVRPRFNPMARPEPSAAGMGSRRTHARRERREGLREAQHSQATPPAAAATNTTTATAATNYTVS